MKKTLLLVSMLLLFVLGRTQAAHITHLPSSLTWNPVSVTAGSYATAPADGQFKLLISNGKNAVPTTVYARISHENVNSNGTYRYVDVVVRFYEDEANTIPYSVSLTVYYRVIGFDGTSGYDFNSSAAAGGDYVVLAYNIENDFNDGTTSRYRDYHLLDGDYIPQPL